VLCGVGVFWLCGGFLGDCVVWLGGGVGVGCEGVGGRVYWVWVVGVWGWWGG